MAWASAVIWLGAQVGPALARSIADKLRGTAKADQRIGQVAELITAGSTAIAALQKVFGHDFDKAIADARRLPQAPWTYEAARSDYIRIDVENGRVKAANVALRDELNINLDHVARLYSESGTDVSNYFLGVFREWMARYRELLGSSVDAEQTFRTIESLLDGRRKTFADVFRLLQKTGLGTVGALLVIQGALIATSTGIGAFAAIYAWLVGVPVVQVGALVVGGALLFALSRVKFKIANAMSASVTAAYKLLERVPANAVESPRPAPGET